MQMFPRKAIDDDETVSSGSAVPAKLRVSVDSLVKSGSALSLILDHRVFQRIASKDYLADLTAFLNRNRHEVCAAEHDSWMQCWVRLGC